MERRYGVAGAAAYLNGAAAVAAGAHLVWSLAGGWYRGTLIPLPGSVAAIGSGAILLLAVGALWLYAGSQISYGVPGWSRETAVAFAGGILAAGALTGLVSAAAGGALLLINVVGMSLLMRDPDGRMHPFRYGAAALLLAAALTPGLIAVAADLAAGRVEQELLRLQPERDEEVAALLADGLRGTRRFAAVSLGATYQELPGYREMLEAGGRSRFYAVGHLQVDACRSWGVQSLTDMGGSSFLLLESGRSGRGDLVWQEEPQGRRVGGGAGPYSMFPYLPTLRPAAAAGAGAQMGLCSLIDGISRSVESLQQEGDILTLTVDPARSELAARVGHVLRSFSRRQAEGVSPALNALTTLTGQPTPDLRSITSQTRQIRIRLEEGLIVHLSTLVASESGLVPYDSIGLAEGDEEPPAMTGPDDRDEVAGLLLRRALLR